MCHIKTNSNIKTGSDLNGMICGIILRQCVPFRKDRILSLAKEYSRGAAFPITDKGLESMIDDRLDLYERNDDLLHRRGMYYPRALERYL